jgi:hypothetical protein
MPTASFAFVSLLALGPAPVQQKSVALLPPTFDGQLEEHWRSEIETGIGRGFSQGDFALVSADALAAQAGTCADPTCRGKVAATSSSDLVVFSGVAVEEKDFKLSMEVFDGSDGALIASVEDTCGLCGQAEVAEMAEDLASTLRSKLDALAKAPPVIMVTSDPAGAKVSIDGEAVGTTPVELEIPEGKHVVKIERAGFVTQERTITTVSGVRDRVAIELFEEKKDWRRPAWIAGWVALGTGVAGIAAGATLMAIHQKPFRRDCQADADGDCRHLYDTQLGGILGLAVGGVATVTGIALIAASRSGKGKKKSSSRAHITPSFGGFSGRF